MDSFPHGVKSRDNEESTTTTTTTNLKARGKMQSRTQLWLLDA